MPRGYRFIIIASGLAAILVSLGTGAFFGALYAPDYSNQAKETTNRTTSAKQSNPSQIDRDRPGLPYFAETIASAPDPQNSNEHENRDLAAQEASALWSFWMLVATGFSALVTMIGTGFLLWQIMLTRKAVQDTGDATDAMRKANDIALAAQRPWIAIALYVERAVVIDGRLQIQYRIDYKNIGQTVAQFFVPKHTVEITGGAFTKLVTEIQSAAREKDVNNSRVLMPNEIYNHTGKKNYDLGKIAWLGRRKRRFLAVSASAFYNLPGDKWGDQRRHTERTFLIVTEDTSGRPEEALFRSRLPEEGHVRLHIKDAAPRSAS
jgi:hypothetical protein